MTIRAYNTLQFRFAFWTAMLLMLALIGFGSFVYLIMASELARSIDESLSLSASQAVAAAVDNGQLSISDGLPAPSAINDLGERGFTIRILRLDGTILRAIGLYSDLAISPADIEVATAGRSHFNTLIDSVSQEPIRFYTAPIMVENETIAIVQVAQSLDTMNDTLEQLLTALLISIPLLVALAALAGYVLATRALSPINAITRTAQEISATDLHQRLNLVQTEDEVGRLAGTFDTMLERLESSFQRERQFTADASHELRTPLTAMQTMIAVTREQKRLPEYYEAVLDDFNSETQRLKALVEDLLQLARGDSGVKPKPKIIELSLLLDDVKEVIRPLVERKQLRLGGTIQAHLQIMGDSDNLVRLFMNLLDNAIKYTDYGEISIQAYAVQNTAEIIITDTGIGIDKRHLEHVFDRFYRVDLSRSTPGNGLGLSIAQSIVQAHEGKIQIASELGKGTSLKITLPLLQK